MIEQMQTQTQTQTQTTDEKNIQIVISRYNESLDWINTPPFNLYPIILYNKGDNDNYSKTDKIIETISLPNVGRESHTYLYHVIHNYNNLADITIFLPGSTDSGNKTENAKRMINGIQTHNKMVFPCEPKEMDSQLYNFEIGDYLSTHPSNKQINTDSKIKRSDILPYGKWHDTHFPDVKTNCLAFNGIFSVSKENILQKPISFYETLLNQLDDHHNPEVNHFMERSWYATFGPHENTVYV
jgi:hypothetical protein